MGSVLKDLEGKGGHKIGLVIVFIVVICQSYTVGEEGIRSDQEIWKYFVEKYSSSGSAFSSVEVQNLARSQQKCEGSLESTNKTIPGSCGLETLTGVYNESKFEEICPQILYWIENKSCCPNSPGDVSEEVGKLDFVGGDARQILKKEKPSSGEVWGYGILLVTIISFSSLAGVSLMPFMGKSFYKHLLTVMVGLAVGSLTGSAVFHLIPQALNLSEHDPDHSYLHIALVISGGIWLFFMIERILKFIMDYKDRKGKNWKREKMSSVLASSPDSSSIAVMTEDGNLMKEQLVGGVGEPGQRSSLIFPTTMQRETDAIYECQEQAIKASFGHQEKPSLIGCHDHHNVTFEQGKDSVIATVAWMIIFGDGLHNFIDGLSIGAAFNESIWTGVSISVAVLCEELPHELGDFAVLLNAGMTMRQAVCYNFLSACTCYIGMAVGILLGEIEASRYIFALAGGMFLYISLVDMVPEMNEIAQETSKVSLKKGFLTLLLQNIGLFSGITALYLLALYQDSFQF